MPTPRCPQPIPLMWAPHIKPGDRWEHKGVEQCVKCGAWLQVPVDSARCMRKHHRGLSCKIKCEYLHMQEKGLIKVDVNEVEYLQHIWRTPLFQSHVIKGKYAAYAPASLLCYAEYMFPNPPAEVLNALEIFMSWSPDAQQAHLDGLTLAYETWRDTHEGWLEYDEPPF